MKKRPSQAAFTLVELLAALAVLAMLMVVVFGVFNQASRAWLLAENRTENFSGARMALDLIGRDLEGAMVGVHTNLNGTMSSLTLVTFDGAASGFSPGIGSSTQGANNTALFFITPAVDSRSAGTYSDLAECGYYVVQGSGSSGLKSGNFYLMRHYVRSTDSGYDIFASPSPAFAFQNWWSSGPGDTPVLENTIQFVVGYEMSCPSCPQGTTGVGTWDSNASITNATVTLPRAFNLQLSVMDRRYAARAASLGLGLSDIANIPNSVPSTAGGIPQLIREAVRTFYRSVYPREAS